MKTSENLKQAHINKSITERVESFKMAARPIYPYDAGLIAALLNIGPDCRVLEAGTGSGGTAAFFAHLGANVTSYERNPDFYKTARLNLAAYDNVRLVCGDVVKARGKYDAIFLDLQNPAEKIGVLTARLKPDGFMGVYTPHMDDLKSVWHALAKLGEPRAMQIDLKKIVVKRYARIAEQFGFPGFFLWTRRRMH